MVVAIIVALIAIFLSYSAKKSNSRGLELAFLLLTLYWAIRYDFGNDYMSYMDEARSYLSNRINLRDLSSYSDLQSRGEFGWVFLIKLFEPIGFFGLIIVLSIFECYTIYWHIKRYVPRQLYWLATALYCLNPNFMMIGASMLRQWFAICLCLWAYDFLVKRKLVPFLAILLAASTVHTSALIVIPVYFFTYFKNKRIIITTVLFILAFVVIWSVVATSLMSGLWEDVFAIKQFEGYANYMDSADESSAGIIGLLVVYSLSLLPLFYIWEEDNGTIKVLSLITILNIIFVPISSIIPLVTRTGLFFFICSIVVFPATFARIKRYNKFVYYIGLFLTMAYYSYIFIRLFSSPIWHDSFIEYHTIFSVPWQ